MTKTAVGIGKMSNIIVYISENIVSFVFLSLFIVTGAYALWLRYRMRVSKARFALVAISMLASCLLGTLAFLTGPVPMHIINSVSIFIFGTEVFRISTEVPTISQMVAGTFLAALISFFMYLVTEKTIKTWDGPVTINVNELAKENKENNIPNLALTELQRIVKRIPDPLVSEISLNWQKAEPQTPAAPSWHILARNLVEAMNSDIDFSNGTWREDISCWLGEIYNASIGLNKRPYLLFVIENELVLDLVKARIHRTLSEFPELKNASISVACEKGPTIVNRSASCEQINLTIYSKSELIRYGLRLEGYARDLVKRFNHDMLGGTKSTLHNTFVPAHVKKDDSDVRLSLKSVIEDWLSDPRRKQIAITGEYGQGKSTAMLEFCVNWANKYIAGEAAEDKVPLLIELRGQSPGETDPVTFLSAWASRYNLPPKQIYNIVRAGEAIIIFEGFDELRNAGRAYDRHEHFNALWSMAYPGTKIVFTGRPNFFLDEQERNRNLKADHSTGAASNTYTEVFHLDWLNKEEIKRSLEGFGSSVAQSIVEASEKNNSFFEIICRPSMIPVVATIWDSIEDLRSNNYDLTGAVLIEQYLSAIYQRKEEEIRLHQMQTSAPKGHSYILLPREVRELFTLAVVWKMIGMDSRNTITRLKFNSVISLSYDETIKAFQTKTVLPEIVNSIRNLEERFKEEYRSDKVERVANEIASAGLFVPDAAGGPSNLRLPHKQFYEYLIAKSAWIIAKNRNSYSARILSSLDGNRDLYQKLISEPTSISFFSDVAESDTELFNRFNMKIAIIYDFIAFNIIRAIVISFRRSLQGPYSFVNAEIYASYKKAIHQIIVVGIVTVFMSYYFVNFIGFTERRSFSLDEASYNSAIVTYFISAITALLFILERIAFINSDKLLVLQAMVAHRLQKADGPKDETHLKLKDVIYETWMLGLNLKPKESRWPNMDKQIAGKAKNKTYKYFQSKLSSLP